MIIEVNPSWQLKLFTLNRRAKLMRPCQQCGAPLSPFLKVCDRCGTKQADKLGLSAPHEIPMNTNVAEENRRHDEWLAKTIIATIVACWVGLSIAAGVTADDTFAGIGTFLFLGVLAWILYVIMGGDIGFGG